RRPPRGQLGPAAGRARNRRPLRIAGSAVARTADPAADRGMTSFPTAATRGRVAIAALLVSLTAMGCAESSPAPGERGAIALPPIHAIADERDLVSLLPETVDSILTVDLARLRGSAFARPLLTAATSE